ncbi:MAG: 5-formyltetrahydrofolate cyclo-ligase [Planktomarina sp.]
MTLDDQKKAARAAAFARRKVAFETRGPGVSGVLSSVLAGFRGVPTAGFMPINTEIDPRSAMAEVAAHGPVGIPVIMAAATPLKFAEWAPDMPLVEGAFKAQIPEDPVWMIPEIVIVPLVAWDRSGGRLGYGGGFYDRTLEGLRARGPVLAIGFAFDAQEATDLPLEPTDQPLDMIVTETQVHQIAG